MNNENQNLQGELNDEALESVAGGWRSMKCLDCGRSLILGEEKAYSYGNDGVVCSNCEWERERERQGVSWNQWPRKPWYI